MSENASSVAFDVCARMCVRVRVYDGAKMIKKWSGERTKAVLILVTVKVKV